jgi:diguanylate cyclase (GGDEF)-like protein
MNPTMKIYQLLNRMPWPRSYAGRILLICFIGTHVPLISFAVWAMLDSPTYTREHWIDLTILLVATLAGTAFTFIFVHGMLAPVRVTCQALKDYRQDKVLPILPRDLSDEAGYMLLQVQETLEELDLTLGDLAKAADTDPLTGTGNRRWLISRTNEQIVRAMRTEAPLCAILFDLDRFKSINDRYGHAKGDAVLIGVSKYVKRELRSSHLFARMGGEEFGIILPNTTLEEAVKIANKLKANIATISMGRLQAGAITASFGVIQRLPHESDLSALLKRADEMLYQAKADGRNRVVVDEAQA